MQGFAVRDGALHAEGVPLARLAREVGTPTYVYSAGVLRDRYAKLDSALAGAPHRIHYSCKANGSRGILEVLRVAGSGIDVVSGGELFKALRAGFAPEDILFGGVGKQEHELREAIGAGVKLVNVESLAELRLVSRLADELGTVANVGLRVNPEVSIQNAHRYIATGAKGHKFGIPIDEVEAVGRIALGLPNVSLRALDMHVGSQLEAFDAYEEGTARLVEVSIALRKSGADLRYLDAGGGLPVPYDGEDEPDLTAYARIVTVAANTLGLELLVEPGRYFAAASGVLVTRVLYRKETGDKTYLICDSGMTELLRPSHYDAFHRIDAVVPREERLVADVVGPVCESGDFLALDREMEAVEPGDLLAVRTAGAYGYVMSSTYNARPRVAEVLVDGARWAVVTARETYEDLVRLEVPAPLWRDA